MENISRSGSDNAPAPAPSPRRRRPIWARILIWLGIAAATVVVLVTAVITVAVAWLKPERLTPLVERIASEQVNADVKIGRMELSFWSTFPRLELNVDTLSVRSRALDGYAHRDSLPADADSLLSFSRLHAALNIPAIFIGKISVYDVELRQPRIFVVQATPTLSNLDIFPASEEPSDPTPLSLPDITIRSFSIADSLRVGYLSVPDTIQANVVLARTHLSGAEAPVYALDLGGSTSIKLPAIRLDNISVGLGGDIDWDHKKPLRLGLDDFRASVGDVAVSVDSKIDFDRHLSVETFALRLLPVTFDQIRALIPEEMRGELANVKADLSISAEMELTGPYDAASAGLPSFRGAIEIPRGSASYENLTLSLLELQAGLLFDGKDLNRSQVNITRLRAEGEGVSIDFAGEATDIYTDPYASGSFKGRVEIARLPKFVLSMIPGKVEGTFTADAEFGVRQSWLNKDNFHRIRLSGEANLEDFTASMPELPADLYTSHSCLKFGTNSSIAGDNLHVDSLLTVSLTIDTISATVTGMQLRGSALSAGVGCRNIASSSDTTLINPIGGRITAGRLHFRSSEDSMRVWLRNASVDGSLRRYKGDARKPQLTMRISGKRALYGDRVNRAMLTDAAMAVTVHPTEFEGGIRRSSRLSDSIAAAYPELSADSVSTLARAEAARRRRARQQADSTAVAEGEVIDIGVDNSMRRLMRRWNAHGSLKAATIRVFTPYFPLRNRITGLSMRFNSDSIAIDDTRLRAGNSAVTFSGSISNLTKALTSRNHSQPMKFHFTLAGDTIDVNQIAAAAFAGAAFAERDSTDSFVAPDTDNEQALQQSVASQSSGTDTMGIFVIPSNIEGSVNVRASNIIYSDLTFHRFRGDLEVYNGAINLSQMSASTDAGSVGLNALYSAPTRTDATFAFGMKVNDLNISQFIHLMPSIDSVMPLLSDIKGVINADVAASADIDPGMNLNLPSLKAAVKLSGDSLVLIDKETFRTIGKWLLFKKKERNVIDHMSVEMVVDNQQLELFPFIFDIDRYKLGVMGTNDLALNLHYHIAVLKSPIPFKFGINISGNADKMKIRLGRAKFNEKSMPHRIALADTTRINLVNEISRLFRKGAAKGKIASLDFRETVAPLIDDDGGADTISSADSLYFINQGLLPRPDSIPQQQ